MSSLSEDASLFGAFTPDDPSGEATHKVHPGGERPASVKKEVSKSPTPEPRSKGFHSKKGVSGVKGGMASAVEEGGEVGAQPMSSGRKKRARATPSEEPETNGRKSVRRALCGRGEGEGPVQGSLLEEVLAEKRMALMRSPQVIQFLQHRQTVVQATTSDALLHPHTTASTATATTTTTTTTTATAAQFCVGEVEEDANS
ncbi:hypothetical protein ACOMHN_005245 [Nucella lapillus]